ncbi:hypothetical protein D9M68_867050 [compost metagenome]
MRGEDLVVVVGRQVARRIAERHGLLQAHHDGVGEAAQQHHDAKHDIHDADLLVVDAGEPFVPQVAPLAVVRDRAQNRDAADRHHDEGGEKDRLVERNGVPGQSTEDQLGEVWLIRHLDSTIKTRIS